MKPYRHPHRLSQFNSLGDISLQQLSSSNSRRLSNAFVTQKTIGHEEQIYMRNHELNHYLDKLGNKVQNIINKNQEEMLAAYKNHFFKVKNQLEEFKRLSEDQAHSSSSFMDRIQVLERQLSIFREESLKLFSKVTEKDKMIEKLRFQIDELQSQQRHMNQAMKQMAKQSKQLSSYRNKLQAKNYNDIQSSNLGMQSYSRQFTERAKAQISRRPISTSSKLVDHIGNQNKTISFDLDAFKENSEMERIEKEIKIKLGYLDADTLKLLTNSVLQIIAQSEKRRNVNFKHMSTQREASSKNQTKISVRNRSNYTIDVNQQQINTIDNYHAKEKKQQLIRKSQIFSKNLQMNDYFKKCVECVKKQIGMRKKINTINFYKTGEPISLSDFKKIDFFRLLQLVFSSQQMIQILYSNLVNIEK